MKLYSLLLLVFIPVLLCAQPSEKLVFKVVSLLGDFNFTRTELTADLARASNKEAVKKIILGRKLVAGTIMIKVVPAIGDFYYWPLRVGHETEEDHIVLQSRNSTSLNFYQLSDFKTLFKDTLVLLDTLSIKLYLHNDQYPDDKFVIVNRCKTTTTIASGTRIPLSDDKLLFLPGLIQGCNDISIFNTENEDRELARCRVRLLTIMEKQELRRLSHDLQEDQPAWPLKEKALVLDGYIKLKYGAAYFPQLIEFLETN